MIARLRGTVVEERADRVILEVGGIGYEVVVPPYPMRALQARLAAESTDGANGARPETVLYIYHHVAEHQPNPVLFGFGQWEERDFFLRLITVSGLGPMAAAKTMTIPVGQYASLIQTNDLRGLKKLPGVGTSKAEQIVATLRGKVALFALVPEEELPEAAGPSEPESVLMARSALESLGYGAGEVESMLRAARERAGESAGWEELLEAVWASLRK